MTITLTTLAEHRELVPWVAAEHFREWGAGHPGATLERWVMDRAGTFADRIPWTLVALQGETPVGTAGLVHCDMDTHPELTPWLSGVYVAPAWRRRGIGTILVQAAEAKAKEWRMTEIYLYTEHAAALYQRLGWSVLAKELYNDQVVTIMARYLALA